MTEKEADESQEWKGVDGAIAWHLIERHAVTWEDTAKMMEAWILSNGGNLSEIILNDIPNDIPKVGQIWESDNLQREVVSVVRLFHREADYNIIWRRPGSEKTFTIWLPHWKSWKNKVHLVIGD